MHVVDVSEAKSRLAELLREVEVRGEVLITRRGKPIARLVPAAPGFDRAKARRAAKFLQEASRGLNLDGLSIKNLVAEGRR